MAVGSTTNNLAKLDAKTNPALNSLKADATNTSNADQAAKRLSDNFDDFMLLLTTQLQNQDPTEPLDTNQFTQQLATLSSVEQAVATNKNLETLISMTQNQQVNNAVGFIGKAVETDGAEAFLDGGKAKLAYDVPAGAAKVTLAVFDQAGKAVYTTDAPKTAGRQVFNWDGTNSFTGQKMADGLYAFGVVARDAKNSEIEGTKTYTIGKVTGVSLDNKEKGMQLTIENAYQVPLEDVLSVYEAEQLTNSPSTNNTNSTGTNNNNQGSGA